MDVVCGIEVTSKHPLKVFADQGFDHFPSARMMVLIIANAGSGDAPDVAIGAVFSPPRLIGLDGGTRTDLRFERIEVGLHVVFHPMQEFNNLSSADRDSVQREQVPLNLSDGQTHHYAQRGNQTGKPYTQA